jgi:hypothetical protein
MPWPLVYYESAEAAMEAGGGTIQPGAVWPAPEWADRSVDGEPFISDNYRTMWAHIRPPLEVMLPSGDPFVLDSRAMRGGKPYGPGWMVTGDYKGPPRLTLSPSISIPGRYHGYIVNGELSDDVEGRMAS